MPDTGNLTHCALTHRPVRGPAWEQLGAAFIHRPRSLRSHFVRRADQSVNSRTKSDSYAGVRVMCMHVREQLMGDVGVKGLSWRSGVIFNPSWAAGGSRGGIFHILTSSLRTRDSNGTTLSLYDCMDLRACWNRKPVDVACSLWS